jgi:8-oxo-dGTP pyrophosphatase MutT (NUDIX family)
MPTPEVLSTNVLPRYRIFAIVEQALRLPSGRTVVRQMVQHPVAIVIMPQLADSCLILIAQYRFAVGATLLEFPAGTLEPREAPADGSRDPGTGSQAEIVDDLRHLVDLGYGRVIVRYRGSDAEAQRRQLRMLIDDADPDVC